MHIVMLSSTHSPKDGRIYHKETKTLTEAGHEVTILGFSNETFVDNGNVKFITLPRPNNRFKRVLKTKQLIRIAEKTKPDLIIIHDAEIFFHLRKLKNINVKYIYDAHEIYSSYISEKKWIPAFLSPVMKKIIERRELKATLSSSGLITPVEINADRLKTSIEEIYILHNYPLKRQIAKNMPSKLNRLIYIGGLLRGRKIKDIMRISESMGKNCPLADWDLALYGPFYDKEYWKDCVEIAKVSGNLSRCILKPERVPYSQTGELIAQAKIGLSFLEPTPKYQHAISTKVFDYMAKGTIPIATWLSSYEGLISDADGPIFIAPGDEDKVPQIIADLARDEDAMRQRAETCLKSVREKFNWEADAQHLPEFLERIAGK